LCAAGRPPRWWALVLALFLSTAGSAPAWAGTTAPRDGGRPAAERALKAGTLPVADGWLGRLFGPIRSALGNRSRMVQIATVGMAIGLFIMFSMGKNKA
jgi:hypothetical protein